MENVDAQHSLQRKQFSAHLVSYLGSEIIV